MKPLIYPAIFLMGITFSRAQEIPFTPSAEIRLTPLSLVDPFTPAIQPGVQVNLSKHFAFSADFGYGINIPKPDISRRQFYKLRSEFKLFFSERQNSPRIFIRHYISVEGFYIPEKFRRENGWYYRSGGDRYTYDYNDIHKTVTGSCLKLGGEYILKDRYILDFYFGAGYRNVNFRNNRHTETPADPIFEEFFSTRDQDGGDHPRPHIAAGLKLGFLIWKEE